MTESQTDLQGLLDQILSGGKSLLDPKSKSRHDLTQKGKTLFQQSEDFLAEKLNVGDDEVSRARLRKNTGIAAGAGALALLLSSRSSRKMAALAGLGTLGVIAFKAHRAGQMPQDMDDVIGLLRGEKAEMRTAILLQAMIAAAQADGEVSDEERALIDATDGVTPEDIVTLLETDPNPEAIAALAGSDQAGLEIYAASCRIANGLHPKERDYLDRLAMALRLDPDVAAKIETDVRTGS